MAIIVSKATVVLFDLQKVSSKQRLRLIASSASTLQVIFNKEKNCGMRCGWYFFVKILLMLTRQNLKDGPYSNFELFTTLRNILVGFTSAKLTH